MNKINDLDLFISTWDENTAQFSDVNKFFNRSVLNNLNLIGDTISDTSFILTKNDCNFASALEEGVKDLVLFLVYQFKWITYSSCQGHVSTPNMAYKKRTIQILPRDTEEKILILNILNSAKESINQILFNNSENNILIKLLEENLDSEFNASTRQTIRLLFDHNGYDEKKYFEQIDFATTIFTKQLKVVGS